MLEKIKPKYDQLNWLGKIVLLSMGFAIMIAFYIWSCTNSLSDDVVLSFLKPIIYSLKIIEYTSIGLIFLSIILRKEIIYQYLQAYGLTIVLSVLIVMGLSYAPCLQDYAETRTLKEILKRSLLCPEYSNRSWINLFWFGTLGIINYGLPIIIRINSKHTPHQSKI